LPSDLPNVVLDARQGNGRVNVDDVPLNVEPSVLDIAKRVVGGDEGILPAGEAADDVANIVPNDKISWFHFSRCLGCLSLARFLRVAVAVA